MRGTGSSPLTRGKRPPRPAALALCGLIPAHAGKTIPYQARGPPGRAHPRSRGENCYNLVTALLRVGSSPLTRGKHLLVGVEAQGRGLIPAHAGKTAAFTACGVGRRAHPRSRGENCWAWSGSLRGGGSSPLTRGKQNWWHDLEVAAGLIPAHAGKTMRRPRRRGTFRAHPRSRGENQIKRSGLSRTRGSSPLTRGKPRSRRRRPGACRLIPAHAGKTYSPLSTQLRARAHPRSRGENRRRFSWVSRGAGSSPLTRGKRRLASRAWGRTGLIPAHAGKTTAVSTGAPTSRAHPRSRGENPSTSRATA